MVPETKPRASTVTATGDDMSKLWLKEAKRNEKYEQKTREKEAKNKLKRQASWSKPETLPWYLREPDHTMCSRCKLKHCFTY